MPCVWRLDGQQNLFESAQSDSAAVTDGSLDVPATSRRDGGSSSEMSDCDPATDDRNAGNAMSVARRMPSPPLATGSVAWSQNSSDSETLRMDWRVDRISVSYSNSSGRL